MVYRIDLKHFLTHAIDHFTREELTHFQYAVISSVINNGGRTTNIAKINELYPPSEMIIDYADYQDKKILEKMYLEFLNDKQSGVDKSEYRSSTVASIIYRVFINPLIHHSDIVIICDESENDYIDILCKFLKKEFLIEVIDLNELFTKGRVGPIYIDRDEIWDKAVDIRRAATKDAIRALETTRDGRLKLLGMMRKREKIQKAEELGINITAADMKDLDKILIDEWVDNDDD